MYKVGGEQALEVDGVGMSMNNMYKVGGEQALEVDRVGMSMNNMYKVGREQALKADGVGMSMTILDLECFLCFLEIIDYQDFINLCSIIQSD